MRFRESFGGEAERFEVALDVVAAYGAGLVHVVGIARANPDHATGVVHGWGEL